MVLSGGLIEGRKRMPEAKWNKVPDGVNDLSKRDIAKMKIEKLIETMDEKPVGVILQVKDADGGSWWYNPDNGELIGG